MDRKIIVTEDNSKTLLIISTNETYHSTKGALNEAKHVFIDAGLDYLGAKSPIRIFEMGFGTGLNALVTLDHTWNKNVHIDYTGIEKHPLEFDLIQELDYSNLFENTEIERLNSEIHTMQWGTPQEICSNFTLTKLKQDIQELNSKTEKFDLIYFDAFGPKIQPHLWSIPVLQKMYDLLDKEGVLVTYCAQGQFKRNLRSVGFEVENLPGPPGKREMTRAIKVNESPHN